MQYDPAMSDFPEEDANQSKLTPETPRGRAGDQGPRRGERQSTGPIRSESVPASGWSDYAAALSYSSGANQSVSYVGDEPRSRDSQRPDNSQCTRGSLFINRWYMSMDCGGSSWKGFRGANNGGE